MGKNQSITSLGTTLRTFQFANGNNMTGVSFDVNKNTGKTNYFGAGLVGYDFGNHQPCVVALGSIESKSNPENKSFWLSQELYGEIMKEKGVFDSKVTYTPTKVNFQLGKVNLSFNPRVALHFNEDGVTPKLETLTTAVVPFNNKLSGYAMLQTYDTTHLFNQDSKDNISFNFGINYTF